VGVRKIWFPSLRIPKCHIPRWVTLVTRL